MLILVVSGILFLSCDSQTVNEEIARNDTYTFQSIEYYFGSDDYSRVTEVPQEEVLITNNTDQSFAWVTQPHIDATDYSVFKGAKEYASQLNTDTKLEVAVPIVSNKTSRGFLEPSIDRKFRLFEEVSVPAGYYDTKEKYLVPSYSELIMKGTECIEEFCVSYQATFKGVNSGEIVVVKGKWQGIINLGWKDKKVISNSIKS